MGHPCEPRAGSAAYGVTNPGFVAWLDVEAEEDEVGFLDDVVAPLKTPLSCILRALLSVVGDEIVVCDHLRADEALLEIGVDFPCGLRRRRPLPHGPRARLLRPRSEERSESEQVIGGANHVVEAGFVEAVLSQYLIVVFVVDERQFGFEVS